ncbi:MAG: hypothetical protein IKV20_01330 [Clostridia bacterium]|nr:hypothetical protein [Clostridia bacterium]
MEKIKELFGKGAAKCKNFFKKAWAFIKKPNWKVVYDKFTTGLLIILLCSPVLILLYIVLWFIYR